MAKTNWQMGDTVQPADLNQIGQEINQNSTNVQQVTTELNTHMAERASQTEYGHVKIGEGINVTDGVVSATKSSIGLANVENANIATIRTSSSQKLRAEVRSSAPSSPSNGDIWYDSSVHKFKGRANGAWV